MNPTTQPDLTELMSEVQKELDVLLKAEKEKLLKAHPGEETASEVPPDASATTPATDASATDDSAADDSAPADGPPSDGDVDAASAPPEAQPGDEQTGDLPPGEGGDPGAEQGLDPQQLQAEYAQLPIEELKMHYLACKEALFAVMGGGASPDAGAPAPDAGVAPPAAAPPAPDASAPPALKAEKPANGGESVPVKKSEDQLELESLRKKVTEYEDVLPNLIKAVATATAPARRAITSVAQLETPAVVAVSSLSKSEIDARLKRAVKTNLTKDDRHLINQYTVGTIGLDGIKHILESVK